MGAFNKIGTWATERRARLLIVLAIMVVAGGSASLILPGADRSARAEMLRDPLAVLGDRSPGQRAEDALFQTKFLREAFGLSRPATRRERVLPTIRRPNDGAFQPDTVVPPGVVSTLPTVDTVPAESAADLPYYPAAGPVISGGFPGGVIGGGPGGGSGGGGSGGGGDTDPIVEPTPTPPVTAVPEPATWLSLLLGFAFAGAALRRRRPSGHRDNVLRRT